MAMSFGTSVSVNNILALRSFYTFLFNYQLHYKPGFFARRIIPIAKRWVAEEALRNMHELLDDKDAKGASVSLNDVPGGFFAVLYLVNNPHELANIHTGHEFFLLLSQMELEFEKVRKPRETIKLG